MSADNVDKVTEATKNLAALMDGNLEGAALAMQRALEGEFSMFSRYGIKLDLTGDAKEDLENLFENLEEKGAGLLEARAETLSGKWQALKNSVSDFQEEVGRVITDATGLKGGLAEVAEWFDKLQESAKNGALHNLLSSAGERVRNWATDIKTIVEEIKSVEDLKTVMSAVAGVFLETLAAGLEASMELWKMVGSVLFNSFKAEFLAQDWLAGSRTREATSVVEDASSTQRADWGQWKRDNPGASDKEWQTRIIADSSSDNIKRALADFATKIKEITSSINGEVKAAVRDSLEESNAKSTSKEEYFRVDLPDNESLMGTKEGIQGLIDTMREKDEGLADIAQSLLDNAEVYGSVTEASAEAAETATEAGEAATTAIEAATQATEAVKKTAEEAVKSSEAAKESNTKVQEAMGIATTAAQRTLLVAQTTQEQMNTLIGAVAVIAGNQTQTEHAVATLESQIRAMRV